MTAVSCCILAPRPARPRDALERLLEPALPRSRGPARARSGASSSRGGASRATSSGLAREVERRPDVRELGLDAVEPGGAARPVPRLVVVLASAIAPRQLAAPRARAGSSRRARPPRTRGSSRACEARLEPPASVEVDEARRRGGRRARPRRPCPGPRPPRARRASRRRERPRALPARAAPEGRAADAPLDRRAERALPLGEVRGASVVRSASASPSRWPCLRHRGRGRGPQPARSREGVRRALA